MLGSNKNNDYDAEPVKYCAKCYSLKIKYEEDLDLECCGECGCSDILESSIDEWEELYENRYGKKFVNRNIDYKHSYIFSLSLPELRVKLAETYKWEQYIYTMYPTFPGGLGKTDTIILFFDKIIKDNRLDEFRILLINNK